MSLEIGSPRPASLVERAMNIILKPGQEWDRIAVEPATTQSLFLGYAVILAAIAPLCHAIGMVVFGVGIPGIAVYHANIVGALLMAIVTYVLTLAGAFILGLIIEALAPNFGGTKDRIQAMKVAVYSSTAAWVAGVFQIIPMLSILAIIGGLYSLYLLYAGLPKLMRTTADKALPYTALVVVCYIVLFIIIAAITAPLAMIGGMAGVGTLGGAPAGTVQVGGAAVDLGKLQAASAQMQAQAAAMQASTAAAQASGAGTVTTTTVAGTAGVAPTALAALLPTNLGGFARGDISSESSGAAGINASHAEASYTRGDGRMSVEITDMAAMGGLGALASAFNVNSSKQTATGYEKVSTVGGRTVSEEFDNASHHGKYSVLAGRFMIEASGDNVSMDDLKGAVNAVGVDRVAGLARG